MITDTIGEKVDTSDLYELTDENIFLLYKRKIKPFSTHLKIKTFKSIRAYIDCKKELQNIIRLNKIRKLLNA